LTLIISLFYAIRLPLFSPLRWYWYYLIISLIHYCHYYFIISLSLLPADATLSPLPLMPLLRHWCHYASTPLFISPWCRWCFRYFDMLIFADYCHWLLITLLLLLLLFHYWCWYSLLILSILLCFAISLH
jgi:hypothetical protein